MAIAKVLDGYASLGYQEDVDTFVDAGGATSLLGGGESMVDAAWRANGNQDPEGEDFEVKVVYRDQLTEGAPLVYAAMVMSYTKVGSVYKWERQRNLYTSNAVSYTHLTLPTICSV